MDDDIPSDLEGYEENPFRYRRWGAGAAKKRAARGRGRAGKVVVSRAQRQEAIRDVLPMLGFVGGATNYGAGTTIELECFMKFCRLWGCFSLFIIFLYNQSRLRY